MNPWPNGMTSASWPIFAGIGIIAALFYSWWRWHSKFDDDISWRPWHLRQAELAYAERLFRCTYPVHLTAKVDRVYRARGRLHLVELKTRRRHRVYRYDIIELSAQRVAIEGETGEAVDDQAFVLTQTPGSSRLRRHEVHLMTASQIADLARRRQRILDQSLSPCATSSRALCRKCAYADPCCGAGSRNAT